MCQNIQTKWLFQIVVRKSQVPQLFGKRPPPQSYGEKHIQPGLAHPNLD